MSIEQHLLSHFKPFAGRDVLVAHSGGVDSQVLLHALYQTNQQSGLNLHIRVCHINHGLSPQATQWQAFAQSQASALNVPFATESVKLERRNRESLEAVAREARYKAIAQHCNEQTIVVTAHHQDDQLETVLLALKRGSGVRGLSAMATHSSLYGLQVFRPLLLIDRSSIENYANEKQLSWVEDESNQDEAFDRNFIRHQVVPILKSRWPSILNTVSRSAHLCHEADTLLAEVAEEDMRFCRGEQVNALSISALKGLTHVRFNNLVRRFLSSQTGAFPSAAQLSQIYFQAIKGQSKQLEIGLGEYSVRVDKDDLIVTQCFQDVSDNVINVAEPQKSQQIVLPDYLGLLKLNEASRGSDANGGKTLDLLPPKDDEVMSIRFAHDNPKCLPDYRQRSRDLKKVLQELEIPSWKRKRIPFIYYNNQLVAVAGYFVCQPFMAKTDDRITLSWIKQ
ncbi:tRNA lysidine(34) synthetase TilS [Thalassotalea agarivorans]|uniref:tRNA(Ile)-lysidine synthase n=1 Tax=Thalassotalea agarivorans TaxID=349064 RepID=A0A1H9ZTK5_THASX|nr:tRNA lysidine(34) synthetase TilS [Thalassotalea agarivorans]SES85099.1 tRNA(Ile)-lysidine synthase [Thalassotalea agarivorans]